MTDTQDTDSGAYARAIAYATAEGERAGQRAAGWWLQDALRSTRDGAAVRRILAGIEDGDPAVLDTFPYADLSGQWADTLAGPELVEDAVWRTYGGLWDDRPELGAAVTDWFTDICDAYESAYSMAVEDTIGAAARDVLDGASAESAQP